MIRKVFHAIEGVRGTPRRIMLGGLLPALLLLSAAAALLYFAGGSYEVFILSRQMCQTGLTLFSEGMVLGLFFDMFLKR